MARGKNVSFEREALCGLFAPAATQKQHAMLDDAERVGEMTSKAWHHSCSTIFLGVDEDVVLIFPLAVLKIPHAFRWA